MRVGIIGLGLIGGSIGLALRHNQHKIIGIDPNEDNRNLARKRGIVDEIREVTDLADLDIVFVAVPPLLAPSVIAQALANAGDIPITDCTSVKSEVVAAHGTDPRFVPGHPMAGHEKSGPGFSSHGMFKGATWLLTPTKKTNNPHLRRVESLIKEMGANPIRVDATAHDSHVAILSHLPHVLAASLVRLSANLEKPAVGAGSWRDLTRVGGVDPELWSQILIGNRQQLAIVLDDFIAEITLISEALKSNQREAVCEVFADAKKIKEGQI